MMLVALAPAAEDKRDTKMASDNEDDNSQDRASSSVDDEVVSTDNKNKPHDATTETRPSTKSSSSSKDKTRISRSRSDDGDKKVLRSSFKRNSACSPVPPCDDDDKSVRSSRKKSSSNSKSSSTTPKVSSNRRVRPAGELKSERETVRKMRRRPSAGTAGTAAVLVSKRDDENHSSAADKNNNSMDSSASNSRRHRSKSRTRVSSSDGMDRSGRSVRSEKSTRSVRSEKSGRSSSTRRKSSSKPESTLDSAKPLPADDDSSPPLSPTVPVLSLRSSVKVASALVKFRKVLAMSKEASATAQKYSEEQKGNAGGGVEGTTDDTKQGQEESVKPLAKVDSGSSRPSSKHGRSSDHGSKHRSSRHKKSEDGLDGGSKHRSSRNRKSEDAADNISTRSKRTSKGKSDDGVDTHSTRSKRTSKGTSPAPERGHRSSKQSSSSSIKKQEPAIGDAEALLKQAFSNAGKSRRQSSNPSAPKSEKPVTEDNSATAAQPKDKASEQRMKSSAKVSTAMLKFQQALALSKSATQAARTQQDTQNKVLGEVHGDNRTPDDYLSRLSLHKAAAAATPASPVSTIEVDPINAADSPKLPDDLDGDSDIDSEIEIDDIDEDDDTVSDVATDSEDEQSVHKGDDDVPDKAEKSTTTAPISFVSCNTDSDFDMASDVEDHSDVEIDSDDDLDSDEEQDSGAGRDISSSSDDSDSDGEEKKDKKSGSESNVGADDSKMDSDDGEGVEVILEQTKKPEVSKPEAKEMLPPSPEEDQNAKTHAFSRSFSFNSSLQSSQSLLHKSLTMMSKDDQCVGQRNDEDDDDDDSVASYLPTSIARPSKKESLADINHDQDPPQENRPSKSSTSSRTKPVRHEMKRRSSSRTLKKTNSNGEPAAGQVPLDTARKLLGDQSLGRKSRGSSSIRKPVGRSKSTCSAALEESQRDKEQKKDADGARRSSSASRNRTLAGLSNFSQRGDPPQEGEDGRKHSSRRRTPSRAKSHDPSLPVRRSSRASSKSRKSAAPPVDDTDE